MDLIDLALEKGLEPKKTSYHGGGEYHSACPNCRNGKDRFAIWPKEPSKSCNGRYWCRVCDIKRDAIQFCINFFGLNYLEACNKLNVIPTPFQRKTVPIKKPDVSLKLTAEPSLIWQEKARAFLEWCHQQLWTNPIALKNLYERGLSDDSIKHFKIGYYPKDIWRDYSEWGITTEIKTNGKPRMIWLPHGLVIPWIREDGKVLKVNIRRLKWHKEDKYGKYVKIPGSMNCPATYGDTSLPVGIILESEFDSILIQQEVGDNLFSIANGGSCQPLDLYTDFLMRKASLLLFCPDVDIGGAKFLNRLQSTCKNGVLWPAPKDKSPGDAFKDHGVNLREWILEGIEHQKFSKGKTGLKSKEIT